MYYEKQTNSTVTGNCSFNGKEKFRLKHTRRLLWILVAHLREYKVSTNEVNVFTYKSLHINMVTYWVSYNLVGCF